MQKHSKLLLIILIPLLIVLNGCWDHRELNTLAIVSCLGIDKAEEPSKIQITAQIIKPGEMKAGEGGGGKKPYWNMTTTGETVSDTIREFTHESNRKLYLPHNEALIFSQDIAKEGVKKYVDFFVREPESRELAKVLVSKGKANEILDLETELEKIPGINISQLVDESVATSEASAVNMQEFSTRLMSKTTAPVASMIEVSDQGKGKIARLSGTAVFKKDKLVGYLNKAETRGLLWVIDKVKTGIVVVKSPSGEGKVSLKIIRASSKITTEIKDNNEPYITVHIDEEGVLGDQMSPEDDLIKLPVWSSLEKSQADVIQQEVMTALKKAQELNTDIFGFGDAVHRKHPELWGDMEKQWDQYFPDLEVEVIVNAKLSRTGMIKKPPVQE